MRCRRCGKGQDLTEASAFYHALGCKDWGRQAQYPGRELATVLQENIRLGFFRRAGIQEEVLRAMLEGGAVREVLVSRHGEKWGLAIRLGGAGSRWLPLRTRAVCRSAGHQGLCRRAVVSRQPIFPR